MGTCLRGHCMSRRTRGFSITEALLAATLASLVALMALGVLPSAMRGLATSAEELQASDLASEMISRLESVSYSALTLGTWDGRIPTAAQGAGTADQFPPLPYPSVQRTFVEGSRQRTVDYQVLVTVAQGQDRTGAAAGDLKTVTVTIHWRELRANSVRNRSLSVATMRVDS